MRYLSSIRLFTFVTVVTCASVFFTCDDEPSKPPPPIDSTSHAFSWQTDTLGGYLSRVNDVFCLSKNEAWAAGKFYTLDSTGIPVDSLTANLARWDGSRWSLERVDPLYNGHHTFSESFAVFALSPNYTWLCPQMLWNGVEWKGYDVNKIAKGRTRRVWGKRSDDIYFVGEDGCIMHWNGNGFNQIGLSTTADNLDVWGSGDTVYVAVRDLDLRSGESGYLIHLQDGSIKGLELLSGNQLSVWGMNGIWYTGGCSPLYKKNRSTWTQFRFLQRCITGIIGSGANNVSVVHEGGMVMHFNGSTWKEILPEEPSGIYFTYGTSGAGQAIFIGGQLNGYAIVKRGYQQSIK